MSAHMPPTTLIAQLPPMPTRSLNITRAAKFGETAEVMEKIVKMANDIIMTSLRPYDSESGPQILDMCIR